MSRPLTEVLDAVEARIAVFPRHPMYDLVLDREASLLTFSVVLGWRSAVYWNKETLVQKYVEYRDRLDNMAEIQQELGDGVKPPQFGNTLSTALYTVELAIDDWWSHIVRMIDHNFLDTMSKVNLDEIGMRWQTDRWQRG